MGSPPDKNETKIMASKKTSKRMKRLLGNIAHVEGVDNTLPVTERLKMFAMMLYSLSLLLIKFSNLQQ